MGPVAVPSSAGHVARSRSTAGRKYVKAWDIADSQDFAVGVVLDVTEPMHDVVHSSAMRRALRVLDA